MNENNEIKKIELKTDSIKKYLEKNSDIFFRHIFIGNNKNLFCTLAYTNGLVDINMISQGILKPLYENKEFKNIKTPKRAIELIMHGLVYCPSVKVLDNTEDVIRDVFSGNTILIFDSLKKALSFETKGYKKRDIGVPTEESTFRGSKDCFVETLRINTSIIRIRINSPYLTIRDIKVGKQSNTRISVIYMSNICNPKFVDEITDKLMKIDEDKVLFLTDIQNYIIEKKYSIFPQAIYTEIPDTLCINVLDGKVGLIIDGIPYAVIFPAVIADFFQTSSLDYGANYSIVSFLRLLRYVLGIISVFLPGFYIAVTRFHKEMIPFSLLNAISASEEGTPFPIPVEVILMALVFYALIEASFRIPNAIGSTISIVGGLILGEAAITAKLVSPGVIVVVAIASIASLTIPNKDLNMAVWLCQLMSIIMSSVLGLIGISASFLILLFMLCKIEFSGVPYLAPFVGRNKKQLGDIMVRIPVIDLKFRPLYFWPVNKRRRS